LLRVGLPANRKILVDAPHRGPIAKKKESYFGPDNERTLNEMKAHSRTSQYDNQGNEIRTAFLGVAEERLACTGGYHFRKNTYDKWRRLVNEEYFDEKAGPCADSSSLAHRVSYRYDPRGRRIEISYFDEKGQPTLSCDGSNMTTVATSLVCASSV
jgi:hypothetical protein